MPTSTNANHERKQAWQGVVLFQLNFQQISELQRQDQLAKGKHVSPFWGVLLPNQGVGGTPDTRRVFPRDKDLDLQLLWYYVQNFGQPVQVLCELRSWEDATSIGAIRLIRVVSTGHVGQPTQPKPAPPPHPTGHPSS